MIITTHQQSAGNIKGEHHATADSSWSYAMDAETRHESERANLLSDGVLPRLSESGTSLRGVLPTVSHQRGRTVVCTAIHSFSLCL